MRLLVGTVAAGMVLDRILPGRVEMVGEVKKSATEYIYIWAVRPKIGP
jgi:hypothetical protein